MKLTLDCGGRGRQRLPVLVLAAALLLPLPLRAQEAETRIIPAAVGTVAGVAGGGYLALAVIVAEARVGRYIHDVEDVLGWRSAPVLIGAVTGGALGFYSPPRLAGAIAWGAAGMGAGAVIGWGAGTAFGRTPEARWAGAAIGAGLGLAAGNLVGALNPMSRDGDGTGIPFFIVIPVR
jgi:hypothetical protein